MEKYKRLTDSKTAVMLKNTEGSSWDSEDMEAQRYIRLAELEDKIENGTLIELPCKVGDTVFLIAKANKGLYYGDYFTVEKIGFDKLGFYVETERGIFRKEHIFTTKAEAEKKLKEINEV